MSFSKIHHFTLLIIHKWSDDFRLRINWFFSIWLFDSMWIYCDMIIPGSFFIKKNLAHPNNLQLAKILQVGCSLLLFSCNSAVLSKCLFEQVYMRLKLTLELLKKEIEITKIQVVLKLIFVLLFDFVILLQISDVFNIMMFLCT